MTNVPRLGPFIILDGVAGRTTRPDIRHPISTTFGNRLHMVEGDIFRSPAAPAFIAPVAQLLFQDCFGVFAYGSPGF